MRTTSPQSTVIDRALPANPHPSPPPRPTNPTPHHDPHTSHHDTPHHRQLAPGAHRSSLPRHHSPPLLQTPPDGKSEDFHILLELFYTEHFSNQPRHRPPMSLTQPSCYLPRLTTPIHPIRLDRCRSTAAPVVTAPSPILTTILRPPNQSPLNINPHHHQRPVPLRPPLSSRILSPPLPRRHPLITQFRLSQPPPPHPQLSCHNQ